ncbi:MAG: anti-sigma factor family protein [Novosphingobium sp.]
MADTDDNNAISQLLPFYLNGSLPPADRQRIDTALAASPALRAELEEHRRLLNLVKSGGEQWAQTEPLGTPPVDVERQAAPHKRSLRSMLAVLSPSNWSPAISLALALAVVAQAAALLWQNGAIRDLREENYQLASGKDAPGGKGAIVIEVKDDAAWSAVSALLGDEGLTVVSSGDFGTLILGSDKTDKALADQIERLRKSPLIASADPAA